ncbi:MAG: DUF937 domain-containing protein [Saprospiraceae bacterium]
MNLIELLNGHLDGNLIGKLSQNIGAESEEQTSTAASGIISTLIAQLSKNAATPEGSDALTAALDRDHDGSILNDLPGFLLGNKQTDNPSTLNGTGILAHIFGNKQSKVTDMLGRATGLDKSQILKLMISLAPMVLAALGKARHQNGSNGGSIGDILSRTVNSPANQSQETDLLHRFLDKDGDGSVMDDIANFGMKFFQKQ